MLIGIIAIVVLVPIVIVYYNAKNKYLEAHPEKIKKYQCSFCGMEYEKVTKLADGAICEPCEKMNGTDWQMRIFDLNHTWQAKNKTCGEIRQAMADFETKAQMLPTLSVTRTSESGRILVDDNQQVFYIHREGKPIVLHRIADIQEFYLEYEYEEYGTYSKDGPHNSVRSGSVVIKLNEIFDVEDFTTHVDAKMFTQRTEVKNVFESDLEFLEEITGKKRKPIPNKVKLL